MINPLTLLPTEQQTVVLLPRSPSAPKTYFPIPVDHLEEEYRLRSADDGKLFREEYNVSPPPWCSHVFSKASSWSAVSSVYIRHPGFIYAPHTVHTCWFIGLLHVGFSSLFCEAWVKNVLIQTQHTKNIRIAVNRKVAISPCIKCADFYFVISCFGLNTYSKTAVCCFLWPCFIHSCVSRYPWHTVYTTEKYPSVYLWIRLRIWVKVTWLSACHM